MYLIKAKSGKAPGPNGGVGEMLKAAGDVGIQWMTDLCNAVVSEGKIPEDWRKSWMVSVYKGKGNALECGSYRGIKLLDQVMKVLERVIERRVRDKVQIDGSLALDWEEVLQMQYLSCDRCRNGFWLRNRKSGWHLLI